MIQKPLFAPQTEWIPPQDFPDLSNYPEISIDLETKDPTNLFKTKRNGDLAEAIMEFGAIICKPKDPLCYKCILKKNCLYYKSESKIRFNKIYRIFCSYNISKFN